MQKIKKKIKEIKTSRPTCLFKMSQIFSGGSVSWLRELRLGCVSLCTRYNGLEPRTAPWSGKTPAADTGSSTWYCQTTCIVSFWNTKDGPKSRTALVLRFLLSKNIDRETRLQRACPLYIQLAIKIVASGKEADTLYDANKRAPLPKIARSAASFNQTSRKIYDRKLS